MESIFERDFYPTPEEVIVQMLVMSDINNKVILEPSAGSGNIVTFLQNNGAKEVIACEKNNKLRSIVEKKCAVIADDFLTVTSDMVSHIDMIAMNPPFSREEDHILHAYEIAPQGCEIISLCNSSMLDKAYYRNEKRKKIKELIELYGDKERLGCVFSTSERKTDVDVSVIRLYKPKADEAEWQEYFFDTEDDAPEAQANGLITYDFVRDCVNRYVGAVQMFDEVMEASKKINALTKSIGGEYIRFGASVKYNDGLSTTITKDQYNKALQKRAWQWLFGKFNMNKYITRQVNENINAFVEKQQNIPFTMKNIYRMVDMIVGTHEDRMKQVLIECFDLICSFSAENSTAGEKWKTNSDYKINKRFIVPYICDSRWSPYKVSLSFSSNRQDVDDIIKVLCYLTGKNYDDQVALDTFVYNNNMSWGSWYEMGRYEKQEDGSSEYIQGFFRIRGYKKGTMHFEFLDEDIWHKFNYEVAKVKGWQLPKERKKKN